MPMDPRNLFGDGALRRLQVADFVSNNNSNSDSESSTK